MKAGTRIEIHGTPSIGGFPAVAPKNATIAKWEKRNGPRMKGWHIVRFANGGAVCMHESNFRVLDNR